MKKQLLLFLLLTSQFINAQGFVNGSFETTTSTGCDYNNSITEFNAVMSNVVMFSGTEVDIQEEGCGVSNLPDGSKVVGIAGSDALSIELSVPLISGNEYTLTFWKHANSFSGVSGNLELGATLDSGIMGTVIQTVPPATIDTWDENSFTFTAPNNGTHITIRNVTTDYWNQLDDFRIVPGSNANTPPTAVCTNFTAQLDVSGDVTISGADVDGGSSDIEGAVTLSVSPSSFTCANLGPNTVTLTVIDAGGLTATCTATVTVEDNVAPNALCVGNFTIQLDANGDASITAADIDNGSNDACGIASISIDQTTFDCSHIGASGGSGSTVATPTNIGMVGQNNHSLGSSYNPTADEYWFPQWSGTVVNRYDSNRNFIGTFNANQGQIMQMWHDSGSSDYYTANWSFNSASRWNGSTTIWAYNAGGLVSGITTDDQYAYVLMYNTNQIRVLDKETGVLVNTLFLPGNMPTYGGIVHANGRIYIGGNVSFGTLPGNWNSISIVDAGTGAYIESFATAVPLFNGGLYFDGENLWIGNGVSSQGYNISNGNVFEASSGTIITLTVTDNNGNVANCTTSVTVEDTVAPMAVCQDITVELDGSGNATVTPADVDGGSSDACGIASLTFGSTEIAFAEVDEGQNLTITLPAGSVVNSVDFASYGTPNGSNGSYTIGGCHAANSLAIVEGFALGNNSFTIPATNTVFGDPCGGTSKRLYVAVSYSTMGGSSITFTNADLGANNVTLTASDANGNESTCTAVVTVVNNTAPIAVCQNFTAQLDASGSVTISGTDVDGGSSDPDGDAFTLSVSPDTFGCADVGTPQTVTLTIDDGNGATDTCTATVTVEDNVAPEALCSPFTAQLDNTGNVTITAADVDGGSNDACGIASLDVSPSTFACAEVGDNTVTLTVTDVNGNVSTCTTTVTVEDNVAPEALCAPFTAQLDNTGNVTITATDVDGGSNDACGIASLDVSPSTFTCAEVGDNTVTLTVTDVNGNSATCTAIVTVQDNIAPTVNCQDITVELDANGMASITPADVIATGDYVVDQSGIFSPIDITTTGTAVSLGDDEVSAALPIGFNFEFFGATHATFNISTNGFILFNGIPGGSVDQGCCSGQNIPNAAQPNNLIAMAWEDINPNSGGTINYQTMGIAPNRVLIVDFNNVPHYFNQDPVTMQAQLYEGSNRIEIHTTAMPTDGGLHTQGIENADGTIAMTTPGRNAASWSAFNDYVSFTPATGLDDNCGIASTVLDIMDFDCTDVGDNTVTVTVTDDNGNEATCTSTVTVVDNIAPTALCLPNFTIQLDANGDASITVADIDNGSNDVCGIASTSIDVTDFTCANVGPNVVTLTVTDDNANVATCTTIVTVEDNVAPVALCVADYTIQLDANGNASITAADINNGSNDVCGIASTSIDVTDFTCANVGPNLVTLTVIDNNGNSASCTTTITVEDNVAPNALCVGDFTIQLDANGDASITVADIDNGSNDVCGIANTSIDVTDFTCADIGPNIVTLTVTDNNGNQATCTATVTVEDTIAPTFTCQDTTVQLDPNGMVSITPEDVLVGIPVSTLNLVSSSGDNGSNTQGLTDFTVPVVTAQTLSFDWSYTTPDGAQYDTFGYLLNGVYTQLSDDAGSMNQTGSALVNVSAGDIFGFRSLTLDNIVGAATTTVSSFVPGFEGEYDPANWTLALTNSDGNASFQTSTIDVYAIDNCGVASLSVSPNSFDCTNVGDNTVTVTVTDINGNSATCTATVTVEDNVAPIAQCVGDFTLQLDANGMASITAADIDNGSNDACGIANTSIDVTDFTCADVGPNVVTLTVTDNNGNVSTCTTTVTVEDSVAPTALCVGDFTLQLDANGMASITVADIDNGSNDACGIASTTIDVTDFTCANVGPNVVTLTVTDDNGNVSTCTTTVTVEDSVAPTALCVGDFTLQLDANGMASITVADIDNGSNDACGIASTTIDVTDFTCADVGPNVVTLTVTDNNNNVSTCTTTVTVEDSVAPTALCVGDFTIQLDANGIASITAADIDNGSNDACGIATTTIDVTDFTCADVGPNVVTLTVTDNNNNVSTCTTTVTVEDSVAPEAVCQNIDVFLDATGMATIVAADVDGGSNDACGVASTSIDIDTFDCSNVGANDVILTVTDNNGNMSTCTAVVTVIDDISPTMSCPLDFTVSTDSGLCSAMVTFTDALASDNCAVVSVVQTAGLPSGSDFPLGDNIVEFTATDSSGNTSTCSFTITVEDNEAPMTVCQDITIQLDDTGNATIVAADVDGGSNDACGIADISIDIDTFDCSHVGDNDVTLTVTDVNGNASSCVAVVTVEDITAPVVVCQDIIVQLDDTGMVTIAGLDVDGGSSDACGIASYDLDIDTFDCSMVGDNTVTLTVTDVNGNSASCMATVTVEDLIDPTLVCMDITVELDENGMAVITPEDVIASNDDNCGIATTAVDIFEFDCSDIGTPVTVQIFAEDSNGNLATCTAVVTVVDTLAPEITCPADQTVDPGPGNLFYEVPDYLVTGEATVSDNCTDPVTIVSQDPAPGTLISDGVYTVTITAEDEYGNVGSCEFELTVESTLGVEDAQIDLTTIVLFPNPAETYVTLSNPRMIPLEKVSIYDMMGRLVKTYSLQGMESEKTMDISTLSSATYMVVINSENGQLTKQLIKE